jgi:Fe-S cluster biogenesis protein NfuA
LANVKNVKIVADFIVKRYNPGVQFIEKEIEMSDDAKTFDEKVKDVIESIRPMLQNDGGDIELVGIDEDKSVRVRLQGACRGCPGAQMTLKMGVERLLKERVPEVKQVVSVH